MRSIRKIKRSACEERIALAGARLANLLNAFLK